MLVFIVSVCAYGSEQATWVVLAKNAALRAGAGSDEKVVDQVKQGAILSQSGEAKHAWLPVVRGDGVAYIHQGYVLRQTRSDLDSAGNIPIGSEVVDRESPLPLDYKPTDLVAIQKKWDYHTEGTKRLRKEAKAAQEKLFEAARDEGIDLRVVSAYRSAAQQKYLYLRKLDKAGPGQKLVAKPGHSEHQLGTTIDISSTDPKTVLRAAFADTPEGKWLRDNAARFGFRFTYTEATQEKTGFKPEPWHIRYMGAPAKLEPALPTEDTQ